LLRQIARVLPACQRRIAPDLAVDVFSTPCGGSSTISSAGPPNSVTAAVWMAKRIRSRTAASRDLVSANTTSRSVPATGSLRAADRDAAIAYARHASSPRFQFIRIEMAPGADDYVLRAPGHVDLVRGEKADIAGVKPAVVEQPPALCGVAVVAAGRRRAAELDLADVPRRQRRADIVHDPDLMTGQCAAA
jgi:hypothetical protein